MKTTWHYSHLIDLEYFCHQDRETDDTTLHLRDRTIFLDHQEKRPGQGQPAAKEMLRFWLTARRELDFPGPEGKSPGTVFRDAYLLFRNLAAIAGTAVGLAAGFSFFTYTGSTPVNVLLFLLLFVVSQLALAGLLVAACLLRLLLPGRRPPSFYSLLLRGMVHQAIAFGRKRWLRAVAADKRLSVDHAFGIFRAKHSVYGALFYWPLLVLSQLFAIGFNLGLLASTLVKIATSDLAFGWQSTIQISGEAIHRAVMFAALPWSWFVPRAISYPTLTEIEGSRIVLKEGIYHLATGDLIAWWPFLVFCLLFYGLLLRLALLVAGKVIEHRSLQGLKLDTPACLALIRRMRTPLVSTQAAPEPDKPEADHRAALRHEVPPLSSPMLSSQVVLIPDDIFPLCPSEKLSPLLEKRGLAILEAHRFMAGYEQDRQLLQLLAARQWRPEEGVFILMEGWMVPLVDFLTFVKELRQVVPNRSSISLALVGRPKATGFTPVAPEDFAIWRQKVEAAGDPYLTIFSLIS